MAWTDAARAAAAEARKRRGPKHTPHGGAYVRVTHGKHATPKMGSVPVQLKPGTKKLLSTSVKKGMPGATNTPEFRKKVAGWLREGRKRDGAKATRELRKMTKLKTRATGPRGV